MGCTDTDQVTIVVIDTTTIIPTTLTVNNYVTLNGDGLNDVWKITGITSFNRTEVTVFNNQGQIVFTQTGYQNDWGGTYEGNELPDGSYYYVVKVDELEFIEKGILTIISDQ
jgi:gliding motility-associated-like protein